MGSEKTDFADNSVRPRWVSVILPCRNEAPVLAETLSSYLTALDFIHEIIFIDDGSSDGTMKIARNMLSDIDGSVFIRHETAIGTAASLQEGLARVSGHYVFMGAGDDPIDPDLLPTAVRWLGEYPAAGVFSAESRGIDSEGKPQAVPTLPRPIAGSGYLDAESCREALFRMDSWFAGNTCVYRTDVLKNIGIHPELGPFCDGYAAWTAAARHGACFVAMPLAAKRDLSTGAGVGMFRDANRARSIWQAARQKMVSDPVGAYPRPLIDRMESRWRYNTVRAWLEGRFAPRPGFVGSTAFALFRFGAALRYKPFDVLNILARRGGGPISPD